MGFRLTPRMDGFQGAFDSFAMGNYPMPTHYIGGNPKHPLPGFPMRAACQHLHGHFSSNDSLLQASSPRQAPLAMACSAHVSATCSWSLHGRVLLLSELLAAVDHIKCFQPACTSRWDATGRSSCMTPSKILGRCSASKTSKLRYSQCYDEGW